MITGMLMACAIVVQGVDPEPARFLKEIRAVENWHGEIGHQGERGPYQMKPALFRQYGLKPTPENYEAAAKSHYIWCVARLTAQKRVS